MLEINCGSELIFDTSVCRYVQRAVVNERPGWPGRTVVLTITEM